MRIKHKTLQGIRTYNTPLYLNNVPLTNAKLNTYKSNSIATYEKAWGDGMVSNSRTLGGDLFADERIAIDYIIFTNTGSIHKLWNSQIGVPYDDKGISIIESKLNDNMKAVGQKGWLASRSAKSNDYAYTVKVPERINVSNQNVADRVLNDTSIDFTLAGQIENLNLRLNWKTTLV